MSCGIKFNNINGHKRQCLCPKSWQQFNIMKINLYPSCGQRWLSEKKFSSKKFNQLQDYGRLCPIRVEQETFGVVLQKRKRALSFI